MLTASASPDTVLSQQFVHFVEFSSLLLVDQAWTSRQACNNGSFMCRLDVKRSTYNLYHMHMYHMIAGHNKPRLVAPHKSSQHLSPDAALQGFYP